MIKELKKENYHPIPKKFILTPSYTEDNGLLTPTKKTKVSKVLQTYGEVIQKVREEKEMIFSYCYENQKLKEF